MDKSKLIYFDGMKSITFDEYPEEVWKYFTNGPHSEDKTVQTLYQTLGVMFRGVTLRRDAVGSMPFAIYNGQGDEVDNSHDYKNAVGFLPDPRRMLKLLEACLTMVGYAYLYKVRSSKRVMSLKYLVPTTVDYTATERDGLTGFKRTLSTGQQDLKLDDVIYFWPEDPLVEIGPPTTSPCKAALNAGGVLANVDEFTAAFFKRGAIKAMLLTVEDMPNQAERERLEAWWKNVVSGIRNAWGAKVVNAKKITPVVVGEGLKELENQTITRDKIEQIAIALGIPQTMLLSNAANYATATQDDLWFFVKTVVPECEFIAEVLNTQLLVPLNYRIAFLPETLDAFQEDENQRSGAYANYVNTGMRPSIAARLVGLELPEDVEYEDLDPEPAPEAPPAPPVAPAPAPETVATTQPQAEQEDETPAPAKFVELPAALHTDLGKWQRKALKAIEKGQPAAVTFTSDVIPAEVAARVTAGLEGCKTGDDIRAVFGYALTPDTAQIMNETASGVCDAAAVLENLKLAVEFAAKGAPEGHEFYGNQWTGGGGIVFDNSLDARAWALYDAWTALLAAKATRREITKAKHAYIRHRRDCQECIPWLENVNHVTPEKKPA